MLVFPKLAFVPQAKLTTVASPPGFTVPFKVAREASITTAGTLATVAGAARFTATV